MSSELGVHVLVELAEAPIAKLTDADALAVAMSAAVAASGATALAPPWVHRFPNGGLTALVPLAESHVSVHTWPERGMAALDAFTCGTTDVDALIGALCAYFAAGRLQSRRLIRAV